MRAPPSSSANPIVGASSHPTPSPIRNDAVELSFCLCYATTEGWNPASGRVGAISAGENAPGLSVDALTKSEGRAPPDVPAPKRLRGSVTLVALCFMTVLGIGLASYLAVTNQSMKLSNRSYAKSVSEQLAENGLEQALWSFNRNDWSSWTISGTTATRTTTFASTKYGTTGITGSIKLRVDNYNAHNLSSTWNSSANYRTNDLVGYNGIWYRCVLANSNRTPSLNTVYWIQDQSPITWSWSKSTNYTVGAVVYSGNNWYRCSIAHKNYPPPNTSYWVNVPSITVYAPIIYPPEAIVYYDGNWYRRTGSSWDPAISYVTPIISWQWRPSTVYSKEDVICYGIGMRWYRCSTDHTSGASFDSTKWTDSQTSAAMSETTALWPWSPVVSYNLNSVVFSGGRWYRCILTPNLNKTPASNPTYWSNAPIKSNAWDSGKQYSVNDTVSYNGTWYRCTSVNFGSIPSTSSNWSSTANSLWNSASSYAAGSYVSHGGVWYVCILGNTNKTPNNSTYWTALGAPVIYAEGRATLLDGSAVIKTQLRATVATAPLFPNAIAATEILTINGAGTVDSYDSVTDPTPGYSAVLAATGTTYPAVTVTGTTVKGYVAAPSASAAPYAPLWSYGGSATLTGNSAPGIDLTRVSRSPFIPKFYPTSVTGAAALTVNAGADTPIGIAGATTPVVYSISGDLNLPTSSDTLTIRGPVILNISGGITTTSGKIVITQTGSAEIHFAGNLSIGSNSGGGIDNQTYNPKKLILIGIGSPAVGIHNYSATAASSFPFYGCIYIDPTPASTLTIGTGVVIYGALSAKNITFSDEANLHYDTSLRSAGKIGTFIDAPYIITEWRELTDPAE